MLYQENILMQSNNKNNLRILHITHSLNIGGLERVVVDLAKGFKKKGCIVSICCLNGKEPLGAEAEKAGIKVFSLNKKPGIRWGIPFCIARIIREEGINVVHTHNEAGLIYGAAAAILAKISNIIHTEHGKEPNYDSKRILQIAEKLLLKKIKHVVAVSVDLKDKIISSTNIDKNKILVIHNGIDIESFQRSELREKMRMELGISPDSFVIGNIARMVPLKNHKFLITIFKELLKDFPKLKLVLVGDGLLKRELEIYSEEIGLSNSVIFLGERKDIAELLTAFDLFILPSITEGISITLLEAMASGIPIVASKVGGNPEIIENERTGLLIPLSENIRWIETIKSLIKNEDRRIELLKKAKDFVTGQFSIETMIENYEKIYIA